MGSTTFRVAGAVMAMLLIAGAAVANRQVGVSIKNLRYDPDTITIHVGDMVIWSNDDDRDHTVEAEDGSFSSGNLSAGKTFSHTFAKAGKYPYGCTYHPRMKGVVVVTAR